MAWIGRLKMLWNRPQAYAGIEFARAEVESRVLCVVAWHCWRFGCYLQIGRGLRSKPVLVNRTNTLLVAACVSACFMQGAAAMDMNDFPMTPPAPQKPEWAGFYLRNNSGAASNTPAWTTVTPANGFSSSTASPTNKTAGYNFQSGNFVFGVEGSFAAANFDGRFTSPYLPGVAAWSPNMNWLGTVTGRVGYSFGQMLPYVKGGFASAETGSPLQGAPTGSFSQSTTSTGWTSGVGLEYQVSPKLSLGVEYLYTDLSSGGVNGSAPVSGSPEMYSTALKSQSFMGRLNYKPGW
jgi:outer membrane immunogenic protein